MKYVNILLSQYTVIKQSSLSWAWIVVSAQAPYQYYLQTNTSLHECFDKTKNVVFVHLKSMLLECNHSHTQFWLKHLVKIKEWSCFGILSWIISKYCLNHLEKKVCMSKVSWHWIEAPGCLWGNKFRNQDCLDVGSDGELQSRTLNYSESDHKQEDKF